MYKNRLFFLNTVFVVTEACRRKPQRSILFISQALFREHMKRFLHFACITDCLLAAPYIKAYPIIIKRSLRIFANSKLNSLFS